MRYLDTGEPRWHPVLFFGGVGTSASAFALNECVGGARHRALGLRFISVERNGFGETPFMPGLGFGETVDDVLAVAGALEIERFSVVAISGGGPYAARLMERVPERLVSVHLAAAAAGGALMRCGAVGELFESVPSIVADPEAFWDQPQDSPTRAIPGFVETARAEGRRGLGEPMRAAAALRHEFALLASEELPDLSAVRAPVYMYWGAHDALIGPQHAAAWQAALGQKVTLRSFEDSGHDVQYVHWPEILTDIEREA